MNRARFAFAATFVLTLMIAGAPARAQKAPDLKPLLAGRSFTPPLKGEAQIEFTSTKPARVGENIVEKFAVKNASNAPVARLTIDETWYDKSGNVVTKGRGTVSGLLQPGEVQALTLETPFKQGMNSNNYLFTHANGSVKPKRVAKLDTPKEAATKTTTSKK